MVRKARQWLSWRDPQGHEWKVGFYLRAGAPPGSECAGVEVHSAEGLPVTGTVLRQMPVATLTDRALRKLAENATWAADRHAAGIRWAQEAGDQVAPNAYALWRADKFWAEYAQRVTGAGSGSGPPVHPDQLYRLVAAVYLRAFTSRLSAPTKTVSEHFGVPRSTANKWVARARERGYLGATRQGVPSAGGPPRPPHKEERS